MRTTGRIFLVPALLASALSCASEHDTDTVGGDGEGDGGPGAELTPCQKAGLDPSNIGCEFWAVDLDNEAFDMGNGISNDAAAQQFAVAIANDNDAPVSVTIYRNGARVGEPIAEEVVTTTSVPAHDMVAIDLPQREVDGTMGQNGPYVRGSGSGTFVSPHAYRVSTDQPVVAYQFNPIVQQFSNDASILIPVQALGGHYYVIGWPTTNPCGPPPGDQLHQESVPDHGAVTIVGVEPNTNITVVPTHPIAASAGPSGMGVPATAAGDELQLAIGPYDVVNLESDQPEVPIEECFQHLDRDGDFTGTVVRSSQPVAVFSSLERGSGFGGADPPDAPGWDGNSCCTDHMEEQMLPTTALGWQFAVSRSPVRSTDPSYREPDIYRLVGTVDGTVVTTNLPAPRDHFTLGAGEQVTFHADRGFTAVAEGGAVALAQILISQGYIPEGGIGDPTLILFPPAEQHREDYLFLVPPSWSKNYVVLAAPVGASVVLDGGEVDMLAGCASEQIGEAIGSTYRQVTCPVGDGTHRVESDRPIGLTVYGYYNVGSYGYPGGADVEIINPID